MILLLCVECGAPQGADQHRMSVLVPCGHTIHEACATFAKQRHRLQSMATGSVDAHRAKSHGEPYPCPCPSCGSLVTSAVPLFIPAGCDTTSPGAACTIRTASQQDRVFHLQRKLLMRQHEQEGAKSELKRAASRCATNHQQMTELQSAVDAAHTRLQQLEALAQQQQGTDDAPGGPSSLAEPHRSIQSLGKAELRSYLQHLSVQLMKERSAIEQLRQKVSSRHARLRALKSEYERLRASSPQVVADHFPAAIRSARPPRAPPIATEQVVEPQSCGVDVVINGPRHDASEAHEAPVDETTHVPLDVDAWQDSCSSSSDVEEILVSSAASRCTTTMDVAAMNNNSTARLLPPSVAKQKQHAAPQLPRYGRSTGLSLRDLPNRQAALVQSSIRGFVPSGGASASAPH